MVTTKPTDFLMWHEQDRTKPLHTRLSEALERYEQRFGHAANVVLMSPNETEEATIPGVDVRRVRHVQVNTYQVGREEKPVSQVPDTARIHQFAGGPQLAVWGDTRYKHYRLAHPSGVEITSGRANHPSILADVVQGYVVLDNTTLYATCAEPWGDSLEQSEAPIITDDELADLRAALAADNQQPLSPSLRGVLTDASGSEQFDVLADMVDMEPDALMARWLADEEEVQQ
jgi:hypothetical protein